MERLPVLSEPAFNPQPFAETIFEVWPQDDVNREQEPFLRVRPVALHLYHGVGDLLRRHDARMAALLTAWNPGRAESPEFNQAANERLFSDLQASGLAVYPARGTAVSGDWYEDSYVVVGGTYEQYVAWQVLYEQLAFVIFRTDGAVELRW